MLCASVHFSNSRWFHRPTDVWWTQLLSSPTIRIWMHYFYITTWALTWVSFKWHAMDPLLFYRSKRLYVRVYHLIWRFTIWKIRFNRPARSQPVRSQSLPHFYVAFFAPCVCSFACLLTRAVFFSSSFSFSFLLLLQQYKSIYACVCLHIRLVSIFRHLLLSRFAPSPIRGRNWRRAAYNVASILILDYKYSSPFVVDTRISPRSVCAEVVDARKAEEKKKVREREELTGGERAVKSFMLCRINTCIPWKGHV